MIIDRPRTRLKVLKPWAVHRGEAVHRSDENSPSKAQNVGGPSWARSTINRRGEGCHGASLAFEPQAGSRIVSQLSREHLDGDRTVWACVTRPGTPAHAACTRAANDFVGPSFAPILRGITYQSVSSIQMVPVGLHERREVNSIDRRNTYSIGGVTMSVIAGCCTSRRSGHSQAHRLDPGVPYQTC
jgi:hypothetical protein